ncbi:Uncharacterized protein Rs2_12643 [Raphanus sativus]|nr:Uncharacterized protein Rs2_12643 [Raphanus sativus]
MLSVHASWFQRLAKPPSVKIFVDSEPWSEPTKPIHFTGGSRNAESISGVPLLIRWPVLKARGTMRLCSPLHALNIITPAGVCHDRYSGEKFCTIIGYVSSPICHAVQPVHSDVTSFRSAASFISSSRRFGGVQFGDPNPSSMTIWAWPIKGYKEVSPFLSCPISKGKVSKPTFMWGSVTILANLLIVFDGFIETITETHKHSVPYFSYTKSSHSIRLLVDSPGKSTSLSSFFRKRRAVLPRPSFMRNVFPPNTKWRCVSLSIADLLSCVPVRLGPEDATDVVSTIFRGADWILTSQYKVTKSQVSGIALSLAPTHSSYASSSLSFYRRV